MSGFGKAPAGFGAKAPAAGAAPKGFGSTPAKAPVGFGAKGPEGAATTASGFGAKAPGTGFGAGGTGGTGFGAKAPATGFGASTGSGFGAKAPGTSTGFGGTGTGTGFGAAAPKQPQAPPVDPAMMGPGFCAQGAQHWAQGTDLSQLHDAILFEDLVPAVQTHLKTMASFIKTERKAMTDLRSLYASILATENATGYYSLCKKIDSLSDGEGSVPSLDHDVALMHDRVTSMSQQMQAITRFVTSYRAETFDVIKARGVDFWAHGHNATEGPSVFFADTVSRLSQRVESLAASVSDLEAALQPAAQAAADPAGALVAAMEASVATLVHLAKAAAALQHRTDQLGEQFARQFGDAAAQSVFSLRNQSGRGERSHLAKKMGYDPQAPGATPPAATPAASATTGGFGKAPAPAAGADASKAGGFGGFGKAPAPAAGTGAAPAPASFGKAPAGGFAKAPAAEPEATEPPTDAEGREQQTRRSQPGTQ